MHLQDLARGNKSELTEVTAKVVIYEAFVEGKLEAPKHLARSVHDLYFEPKYEEFRRRTIWSLSNAFTSAFKELDPTPQFKATAKLGEFLEARSADRFSVRGGVSQAALPNKYLPLRSRRPMRAKLARMESKSNYPAPKALEFQLHSSRHVDSVG
jgi:hypothetical protein